MCSSGCIEAIASHCIASEALVCILGTCYFRMSWEPTFASIMKLVVFVTGPPAAQKEWSLS